jgi:hypothetical protein
MNRIHVIGASGSGKSTLAGQIAGRLQIPFFATDAWFWKEGWITASEEEISAAARCLFEHNRYAMDCNFDTRRQEIWSRADCIVWLDYPFLRVVNPRRNLGWWWRGELGWSPSRWSLRRALSGIVYSARSHVRKRRLYPGWLSEHARGETHRFKTPLETQRWLNALPEVSA